ncbi:hypothetical protein SESBI_09309 [Sesbania bispinosa]|nr:hypothetical protein SESBI_09309 [Sesbania bispinosa]
MESAEDTLMLPDPPDGKDDSLNLHASFKDKLLAGKGRVKDTSRVDLISNNLFRIEYEYGDRLKPRCYVADSVLQNLHHPRGNNHDDIGNQDSTPSTVLDSQDQLHGEWLVVSRSRKSGAQKGKGKAKICPSDSRDQPEKDKTGNKVEASNKSNRKEPAQGKPNNSMIFKPDPSKPKSLFDFGIKTAMNVDIIEPHRLRFKDDEILQKSLDDKLGVFLQPQTMTEEKKIQKLIQKWMGKLTTPMLIQIQT